LRWLNPPHQHLTMILGLVMILAALFIVLIGAVLAMQLRPRAPETAPEARASAGWPAEVAHGRPVSVTNPNRHQCGFQRLLVCLV
jgi:hypothetical protein